MGANHLSAEEDLGLWLHPEGARVPIQGLALPGEGHVCCTLAH